MKRLILSCFILTTGFMLQTASAQSYKHALPNNTENAIEFTLSRSDIAIEGYSGSEILIENTDYEAPPERAEGLRPLYRGGPDNTGIGLSVEEENGVLKIVQARSSAGEFVVRVPDKIRLMIQEANWGGGRKIEGSLNGGGVEVGPKTISGDIYLRKGKS